MIKVLFVCLGNICRSPLAEAIFNKKIEEAGIHIQFKSDSAGTSDFHIGELPDERTIKCADKHNLTINHRGRQVNRTDIRDFHYIIAMDDSNLRTLNNLKERFGFHAKEIYLMRDFAEGSEGKSVPDPYYGGEEGFEEIFTILDESIDGFLGKVIQTHQIYV
jgi:protein-tyrosine phosphatase